jgi:SAM-dependent methyltransferase
MTQPFSIDDSRMPIRLGSALRVPSYAYKNWGIQEGEYRITSDAAYTMEWESGSDRQMNYVVDSIKRTGMGNFSQILRDSTAEVVAYRVRDILSSKREGLFNGEVQLMDVGAGVSTVNIFDALDKNDKNRVYLTLVEPSRERLDSAAFELEKRGLKENLNFRLIQAPDQHLLAFVEPGTQDIVSYVATLHHHSYFDTPLKHAYHTLNGNGIIVISDWHNPEWEHPARVREALVEDFDADDFGWETKDADIWAFERAYPKSLETPFEMGELDDASYREIRKFWSEGWAKVRKDAIEIEDFDPRDDIYMLEAHRPVEMQNGQLSSVGFKLYTDFQEKLTRDLGYENPHQLRKESRLLMTTVGNKGR